MLLSDNTKRVIDLIEIFDNFKDIDKIRLAIYLLENKKFSVDFNIGDMKNSLKYVKLAVNKNPNDERLKNNLEIILNVNKN